MAVNWVDGVLGGTPITASNLNAMDLANPTSAAAIAASLAYESKGLSSATQATLSSTYAALDPMGIVLPAGATYTQIQAAATSAATFGTKIVASGTITTSSTLVITSECDLSGLTINYTGSGIAVQVGNSTLIQRKAFRLPNVTYTPKVLAGWTAGTIGAQVMNLSDCTVFLGSITNFESGAIFYGSNNGFISYCNIFVRGLVNNKINMTLAADSTGYVNQNNFYGGRYQHFSNEGTQVTGVYHIYLTDIVTSRPNGNNWFGASLESPNVVQYAVNMESGVSNQFHGCRWEDSSGAPRVRYGAKAQQTEIHGGFASDAIAFTTVTGATRNMLLTPDTFVVPGSSTPVMRLANEASSGSPTLAVYNAATLVGTYNPLTDWSVALAGTGIRFKGKADSFDRLAVDSNGSLGGRISIGNGAGAADVNLYRSAANVLKTDDKLLAALGVGVGNSAAATTLGTVVKKMEVFDAAGASLGFIPIYDTIT